MVCKVIDSIHEGCDETSNMPVCQSDNCVGCTQGNTLSAAEHYQYINKQSIISFGLNFKYNMSIGEITF